MGVTGLWRLIEPAGKPVPVETLENKVIAVDISIWLHQMVKGYQDTKGAPIPNAHLMGLFQRLCKLLYFRIKPVFVFDGAFPDLKKETIAKRQFNKSKYNSESERLKRELALLLSKKSAISNLLGKEISPKKATTSEPNNDDIFKLPALPVSKDESESESDDEESSSSSTVDLHSVDIESDKFKSLPVKDKYDLLIELKETRKQNSWGRLHELPKKSDNFSDFQLQRLLKRRKVQECLQETEKEMGDGGMSIVELESILNEEGIDTKIESIPTRRIASNNTTRFLLINNVKQALAEAKKKRELGINPGSSKDIETPVSETTSVKNNEPEDDLEAAIKMSLECADDQDTIETEKQSAKKDELESDLEKAIKLSLGNTEDPDTSTYVSKTDDSWSSIMMDSDNTDGTDSEEEDGFEQSDLSSAKAYIMQYSDFTKEAINEIVSFKENSGKRKPTLCNVGKILNDINKEKSVIVDNIDLSSDEDCKINSMKAFEKKSGNFTMLENETDIDATQSSVICVVNPVQDVVLLDTSIEENSEDSNIKCTLEREMSCDITKTENNFNTSSQKSVYDNDIKQPTIVANEKSSSIDSDTTRIKIESSSSDDEFEDVSDVEDETKKAVIQLVLDMDQSCDEKDDIFADIFTSNEIINDANESTLKKAETSTKTTKVTQSHSNKSITLDILKFHETQENPCPDSIKESIVIKDNNDGSQLEKFYNIIESSLKKQTVNHEISSNVTRLEYSDDCSLDDNASNAKEDTVKNVVACSKPTELKETRNLTQETMSIEKLNKMAETVVSKEQELIQEKGRLDRIGRNITEQMTKEAQELLQIFGIPYIVAPMEAEAQCAFLESANLTDGTITDDSDIWLFGGKTVYKNFFNQKKHVLQFLSDRIERSFNLTREQLVLLALLVGSDYTTGVDGVGPVTAMEILASFPYHKKQYLNETSKQGRYQQIITGLEEFKKWVRAGKRTDNTTLKKKLRNVSLTDDFPSSRVVQAYMEPNVENSKEKFTWGEMDITILRDYTKAKFGWSQSKLDEIINPVLKRIQERKSQKTVHDYFKRKVVFQSLDEQMSKRVKAAVQKMGPDNVLIDEQALIESEEPIPTKKRKTNSKSKTSAAKSVITTNQIAGLTKISSDMSCTNASVVSSIIDSKTSADIVIPKTERFQEVIPQREKDKQCLLQNKMKAIELFRKTKIDRKKKFSKRKVILPKEKAELSESSNSD